MAKNSELASKLLHDAAGFFDSLSEQNEPLREQMQENANIYRQIGHMITVDPGGKLDDKLLSERAARLLKDAASFFDALGDSNAPLKDQMTENTTVFAGMAKLLESDPMGEVTGPKTEPASISPSEPSAQAVTLPQKADEMVQRPVPSVPRAAKATLRRKKAAPMAVPNFSKPANPGAKSEPVAREHPPVTVPARKTTQVSTSTKVPHPSQNPLSPLNIRLNAHKNYIEPVFGLTFPTAAVPRPTSLLQIDAKTVSGRDNHVCRYCGFRSQKYQVGIGPFDAITNSQAHCACIMCAQVMSLDRVPSMRSGVLLHLPEIGQAELHVFARLIYVCRISQGLAASLARAALDKFMLRRDGARKSLGSDDPLHLVERLARCKSASEHCAVLDEVKNFRLFPLDRRIIQEKDLEFNQFPQILAYWRSQDGPYGGLAPQKMDITEFQARIEAIFGPLAIDA